MIDSIRKMSTSMFKGFEGKQSLDFLIDVEEKTENELFAVSGAKNSACASDILVQILTSARKIVFTNRSLRDSSSEIFQTLRRYFIIDDRKADNIVIKSSEQELSDVFSRLAFNYLILTDAPRDEKEAKNVLCEILDAIAVNSDLKLIINADDPGLSVLNADRENICFGFNKIEFFEKPPQSSLDAIHCKYCREILDDESPLSLKLDKRNCKCTKSRPPLNVQANVKIFDEYSYVDVTYKDKSYSLKLKLTCLSSLYGALAAIGAALAVNVERKEIINALQGNYIPRVEEEQPIKIVEGMIHENAAALCLFRNARDLNKIIQKITKLDEIKLVIALNDKEIDSKDVSWIWDVDFEGIADFKNTIYLTGTRADDVALRLKHAHLKLDGVVINNDFKDTMREALSNLYESEKLFILASPSIFSILENDITR